MANICIKPTRLPHPLCINPKNQSSSYAARAENYESREELLMRIFIQWAKRTRSVKQRLIVLGMGAVIFLAFIPLILIGLMTKIDAVLGVRNLLFSRTAVVIGVLLMIIGGIIGMRTVMIQFTQASGTPFPFMPTQRLIINGPFAACRNPMTLGTILAYLGLSLLIGSLTSILTVVILATLLLIYIKRIEEKELELRFGVEYVKYKAATPFLLPNVLTLINKTKQKRRFEN
ncbi:MAG: isoprenylcysteine carboxylmethyltransferase family protein [Calditrichaeota bacterium]|nr:MAG: isoprenylcysteine carboxylmethyltransferase family protein [Calditrichota bacterium]